MNLEIIQKNYELGYNCTPDTITPLSGGYRNQVFLCQNKSVEDCIIKMHRENNFFDFYTNELSAYKLLEKTNIRKPKLLFFDKESKLLALSRIPGELLQESQTEEYYLESLDLLKDTYEKFQKIPIKKGFFIRDPENLIDGISMLNHNLGLNLKLLSSHTDIMSKLQNSHPVYNIGSFIPNNVIRNDLDYHIDLEMFSIGNGLEDLAYFSLFSGINPINMFEHFYNESKNRTKSSFELFKANVFKLSYLTLGLYSRELVKGVDPSKQKVLTKRIHHILNSLSTFNDENIKVLKEGFNEFNM